MVRHGEKNTLTVTQLIQFSIQPLHFITLPVEQGQTRKKLFWTSKRIMQHQFAGQNIQHSGCKYYSVDVNFTLWYS